MTDEVVGQSQQESDDSDVLVPIDAINFGGAARRMEIAFVAHALGISDEEAAKMAVEVYGGN